MSGMMLNSQYREKQVDVPEHTAIICRWWGMHFDSIFLPTTANEFRGTAEVLDRMSSMISESEQEVCNDSTQAQSICRRNSENP